MNFLKINFKIYIKIDIKTAPTCFGAVTPSSGSALVVIAKDTVVKIANLDTRVGTLIVATIYLQLIQNRYMFRSFTVLHCSHQHCVQPVSSDVEVV